MELTRISIAGIGAVSPAGWGVATLRRALVSGTPIAPADVARPGWDKPLRTRQVPAPAERQPFAAHARLRRASPISRYAVGAALEALGDVAASNGRRLGIVFCVMSGSIVYSRKFYEEVLCEPATASPLMFPETVFNAPASHLATLIGCRSINYTLVGDPGTFLQGLALAAQLLREEQVDGCLVVGAEESDWPTGDAFRLYARATILAEGAGAFYLKRTPATAAGVGLDRVTDAHQFLDSQSRLAAARRVREQLPPVAAGQLLCDSAQGIARYDAEELETWGDWTGPRLSPKRVLGEGLTAAAAWQCVAAVDALQQQTAVAVNVSVVGCNQQAIGAHFVRAQ